MEINAEGTTDFNESGADKLYPSGIDIAITRGFEGLGATAGSDAISEPVEKAAPNIEITLSFAKKETERAAYFDAFNNRDFKKMRIKFEADDIPAQLRRTMKSNLISRKLQLWRPLTLHRTHRFLRLSS